VREGSHQAQEFVHSHGRLNQFIEQARRLLNIVQGTQSQKLVRPVEIADSGRKKSQLIEIQRVAKYPDPRPLVFWNSAGTWSGVRLNSIPRTCDDTGAKAQELQISADLEHHLWPLDPLRAPDVVSCEWKHFWSEHDSFVANKKQRWLVDFSCHESRIWQGQNLRGFAAAAPWSYPQGRDYCTVCGGKSDK
jgi:hypothetical protein